MSSFSYPFKELLATSGIIFYHCSVEENFPLLFISDNVEEILGFTPDEFYQKDSLWMDRLHPDDHDEIIRSFEKLHETNSFVAEFRFLDNNNEYIWLRDEVRMIRTDNGKPESIVGSSINITSRKKAEEELNHLNENLERRIAERTRDLTAANRKLQKQIQYRNKAENKLSRQEEKLRLLQMAVANINDMVIITKVEYQNPLNSKIAFVNRAFEEFTGYELNEVIGKSPTFLHGPDTSTKVLKILESKILSHQPYRTEFLNYKKDGTPYWVELDMSPFPSEDEGFEYWVGINRDVTERKKTEIELEESEHRHRAYTELSFDAIFEIKKDGTITDCNVRACEMFGYPREEMIGMNTRKLMPEEFKDTQPDIISENVTTGSEAWERVYQKRDGTRFTTEINTKMYTQGDEKRIIAYVRDISEQKRNEQMIKTSLKEKETLLAEIHHRVKNNLAIISGLLEMQTFNAGDDIVNELRESQARIQSIAMVHERLYQSDSFTNIPLGTYIDELFRFIANTFNTEGHEIKIEKEIESVALDVSQAIPCGLILNELITNAYKHAFDDTKEPIISISLFKENGTINLEVKDNGKGLPSDFEVDQPSSLGTTLIRTLVQQLNGDLKVHSNQGATFSISFNANE
ncbi:PAS domain S-box protein [Balneolaceae bacterium YR4-1]|uniref:histidine kinase n=1 Tax=Halalkalibaculum roseum TaxID=2709311 RepID=A0A6M1T1I2_9BACT|nr:PAS domain S-box protein [Halalkalibaculum roseum]NGP77966.1 PAS domain S-box protein [Halalkalibaculum roseum]